MYTTRPVDLSSYCFPTFSAFWEGQPANCLLLAPSHPQIFLLPKPCGKRENLLAYLCCPWSDFSVCAIAQLLSLSFHGVLGTFSLHDLLPLFFGFLVGFVDKLVYLIDQVKICFLFHGSDFDTTASVYA